MLPEWVRVAAFKNPIEVEIIEELVGDHSRGRIFRVGRRRVNRSQAEGDADLRIRLSRTNPFESESQKLMVRHFEIGERVVMAWRMRTEQVAESGMLPGFVE